MFFFLSKTAGYLAQPLVIVTILFIIGLVLKNPRRKKILLITSFSLLMLFSNQFLAIMAMRLWEIQPIPFADVKGVYDYGIVLTGVTRGSAGLPGDRVYFNRGIDRATHTVQLYKLGLINKVIISGGVGLLTNTDTTLPEADELATFMTMVGVKEEDIVIENESRNTYESALNVKKLLVEPDSARRLLLITSGYHVRRAKACFDKAGVQVDIFSTNPLAPPGNLTLDMFIVPKAESFGIWQSLFKELAGMVAYKLTGYI